MAETPKPPHLPDQTQPLTRKVDCKDGSSPLEKDKEIFFLSKNDGLP
jgi:hypothetical protein